MGEIAEQLIDDEQFGRTERYGARRSEELKNVINEKRMKYALEKLAELNIFPTETNKELRFTFKERVVYFFPYTGWHSGKSIKAGRGIEHLLKQLTDGHNK